jgi:hypothetical protein
MPSYRREVSLPGKTSRQLYDKVASDIARFLEKTGTGQYQIIHRPEKLEVAVEGAMFSAVLSCSDGKILLDGKLSLLASAFRGKIDQGIDRWLEKAFSREA